MNRKVKYLVFLFFPFFAVKGISQDKKDQKGMDKMWGEQSVSVEKIRKDKGKLFDESNFGMFIHWGLFSKLGGEWKGKTYYGIGEWIMNSRVADIQVDDYKKIANDFNPRNFDAKAIAQLAKDAGMKYIIITSKHHEGFAMFDSKADPFNIVAATPFARDPMKELSEACRKLGLGFGFYYSHNQDWTTPGGTRGPTKYPNGDAASFDDYFYKKCLPQVKELCTNYGPLDFIWFDTPGDMKKELVIELAETVQKLQPNAMLCSRIGYGMGDYVSLGDMEIPLRNKTGLWESCGPNNDTWGYTWYDQNFKTPKELLFNLITIVSRGGTYLLNIGPDGTGSIPSIGTDFLREAGQWIRKHPKTVYKAGSSPWGRAFPWGDVTTQDKSLYLSVFEWPQDGKLYLPGLKATINSATLIKDSGPVNIPYKQKDGWIIFEVGKEAVSPLASVIELKLNTDAKDILVDTTYGICPNAKTRLSVEFATVSGAKKGVLRWMEKFGEWERASIVNDWKQNGKSTWEVNVFEPGYYKLDLRYSGKNRLVWKTVTDEGILVQNQQAATNKFQNYPMGIIEFKASGKHTITTSLVEGDGMSSNLDAIEITPIK